MKKFLIIAITTLGLVLPLGGPMLGSAEAKKPPRYKVSAEINSTELVFGQPARVTGTVSPLPIGRMVYLQKKRPGKAHWKKVDWVRIGGDGTFELFDYPSTNLTRWYRVVKKAGAGHRKGVSKRFKVAIEPWDGRVDVKLFWDNGADLNLLLEEPVWGVISEDDPGPSKTGGEFDPASTKGCGQTGAFEHVSWPLDDAPFSDYIASVVEADPATCDGGANPAWRLELRVNGMLVQTYRGRGSQYSAINFGAYGDW